MTRWAVYWAPEVDDPLWAAGCAWLGRDPTQATTGQPLPVRREPWRYGFHATLKPPMSLMTGLDAADLLAALERVLADHAPFDLPPLQVATLHDFVALRPAAACPPLQALADDCVTRLDALRRPLDAAEEAHRAAGLDAGQRERLSRWGYPHVLAGWRFHLTLSDRIAEDARRASFAREAAAHFAAELSLPRALQSVAVFEEPVRGAPFILRGRLRLGRGVPRTPR